MFSSLIIDDMRDIEESCLWTFIFCLSEVAHIDVRIVELRLSFTDFQVCTLNESRYENNPSRKKRNDCNTIRLEGYRIKLKSSVNRSTKNKKKTWMFNEKHRGKKER